MPVRDAAYSVRPGTGSCRNGCSRMSRPRVWGTSLRSSETVWRHHYMVTGHLHKEQAYESRGVHGSRSTPRMHIFADPWNCIPFLLLFPPPIHAMAFLSPPSFSSDMLSHHQSTLLPSSSRILESRSQLRARCATATTEVHPCPCHSRVRPSPDPCSYNLLFLLPVSRWAPCKFEAVVLEYARGV